MTGRRPALVVALVLSLLTAACIRDESGLVSGAQPVPRAGDRLPPCPLEALARADGPVRVPLWYGLGGEAADTMEGLAAEFNASQSEVVVDAQSQGNNYPEVLRKYLAGIPSGDLPAIAYMDVNFQRQLVDTGTLFPSQSCMEAEGFDPGLLPAVRSAITTDGVLWPGYVNVSNDVLYYNVNHFRRAGLDPDDAPGTFDELEAVARQLKEAGIERPLALLLNARLPRQWINGGGAELVDNNNGRDGGATRATFDNPVSLEVFRWIDRMVDDGLVEPVSNTDGQINQYLAVANQTSSMVIEVSTASTTIEAFLGGEDVGQAGIEGGGEVDPNALLPAAAPLPGVDEPGQVSVAGGSFYLTGTGAPEVRAAAWRFMRFMFERDSQVRWHLEGSYLPVTQGASDDPRIAEFRRSRLAGRLLQPAAEQLRLIDPEQPGPQIGPYQAFNDAIEDALDAMVFEGRSPADAVADAQAELDELIRQYREDNAG